MRRFLKWTAIAVASLLAIVFLPMLYVETMCRGEVAENASLDEILAPKWHREEARTVTTFSEWYIVYAYEDYAEVIKNGDPHDYKYLNSIFGYWSTLCQLSKTSAPLGGMSGESKQLVYTIGGSFTLELLAKAAYEETIGRVFAMIDGDQQSSIEKWSYEQARDYGGFLHQVPWYKWDFERDVDFLSNAQTPTLRDKERAFALGLEFWAKAGYAKVIAGAVAATGVDELEARSVVRKNGQNSWVPIVGVTLLESKIHHIIQTPRYAEFNRIVREINTRGEDFVNISGNDDVMVSVLTKDDAFAEGEIHRYKRQPNGDWRVLRLVKVEELSGLNGKYEYLYDY